MPDDLTTPPIAPPTVRGAIPEPDQENRWPFVLGIIVLILGAVGLIGLIGELAFSGLARSNLQAMSHIVDNKAWTWISIIIAIPLDGLLIAFGIGCLRRRRWAAPLGMIWSAVRIPLAIVSSIIGNYTFKDHLRSIAADPNLMPPGVIAPPTEFIGRLALVMGTCLSCVLPIFILIWLRRPSIKAEVAKWK